MIPLLNSKALQVRHYQHAVHRSRTNLSSPMLPSYHPYQVRHYQHAVHRSRAHLSSPSLAATLNLLLLRWLARD